MTAAPQEIPRKGPMETLKTLALVVGSVLGLAAILNAIGYNNRLGQTVSTRARKFMDSLKGRASRLNAQVRGAGVGKGGEAPVMSPGRTGGGEIAAASKDSFGGARLKLETATKGGPRGLAAGTSKTSFEAGAFKKISEEGAKKAGGL
jgi:hypothetical protein